MAPVIIPGSPEITSQMNITSNTNRNSQSTIKISCSHTISPQQRTRPGILHDKRIRQPQRLTTHRTIPVTNHHSVPRSVHRDTPTPITTLSTELLHPTKLTTRVIILHKSVQTAGTTSSLVLLLTDRQPTTPGSETHPGSVHRNSLNRFTEIIHPHQHTLRIKLDHTPSLKFMQVTCNQIMPVPVNNQVTAKQITQLPQPQLPAIPRKLHEDRTPITIRNIHIKR